MAWLQQHVRYKNMIMTEKIKIEIGSMAKVPKKAVSLEKLRSILTLVSKDSGFGSYKVQLFDEYPDYVMIPRYYAMKVFKSRSDVEFSFNLSEGEKIEKFPKFIAELRTLQKELAPHALKQILDEKNLGGILNLAVGTGKTVLALWIASQIKLKTLVIVHKEFLVNQWRERINEFLPDAKVGRIQQDECEVFGKDFVIGMVHSLALIDRYPRSIYDMFGLVIVDETHRMAAPTFSQALPKFNSKYRVGLSATVARKDEMEDVFKHSIGPIVVVHSYEDLAPQVKRVFSSDVQFAPTFPLDRIPLGRLITIISKNQKRNRLIAGQIAGAAKANRKVIVMSDRLAQLTELKELIRAILNQDGLDAKYSMGFYVGGMDEASLKASADKDIILSTFQMAKEGLDIPDLDTIILATPKGDILQAIGRILRVHDTKKEPIVVDIIDKEVKPCMLMYYKRMRLYKSKGWK
jgi:hypothetical protein